MLLTGTPVPISSIPNIYNSVDSPMSISTNTVVAGQTLTVSIDDATMGNMTIGCTEATAVTVDGIPGGGQPFPDLYQYGSSTVVQPVPDTSAALPFGSGEGAVATQIGPGMHTVVFTISPDALTEGQTETSEEVNPDGYPFTESFYSGPWVAAAGTATGGTFSSSQAFAITGAPYLEPVITRNTLKASFINSPKLKASEVVKITNSESVKDTLSKTIIYASFDGTLNEPYQMGEVEKAVTLAPGKSTSITVPIKELSYDLQGTYQLIAVTYDTAGAPGVSPAGPSFTVTQPFIKLVPSSPTVVTARNGSANVHFTLTNDGNVTSSGVTVLSFYYFVPAEDYDLFLDYKTLRLTLPPNKPRRMTIKVTASQVATLESQSPVYLNVYDPDENSESVAVTF